MVNSVAAGGGTEGQAEETGGLSRVRGRARFPPSAGSAVRRIQGRLTVVCRE